MYSRILPRTCGRWSPSEMPSVGNCLAISSAVRGPGWRCSCVTRRSGIRIAHTPARARERVERYRNASVKAGSLCCRWLWKAFPSGQTAAAVGESWPWVRRCPCEGEVEIRWVVLEPSRVRRAESGVHARRPLLDLRILRLATCVTALGGSVFRAVISAIPFLLPLFFQLGFGWTAQECPRFRRVRHSQILETLAWLLPGRDQGAAGGQRVDVQALAGQPAAQMCGQPELPRNRKAGCNPIGPTPRRTPPHTTPSDRLPAGAHHNDHDDLLSHDGEKIIDQPVRVIPTLPPPTPRLPGPSRRCRDNPEVGVMGAAPGVICVGEVGVAGVAVAHEGARVAGRIAAVVDVGLCSGRRCASRSATRSRPRARSPGSCRRGRGAGGGWWPPRRPEGFRAADRRTSVSDAPCCGSQEVS